MVNLSADNAQRLKKLSVGSLGAQFSVTRSETAAGMRAKVCSQLPGEIGSTQKRIAAGGILRLSSYIPVSKAPTAKPTEVPPPSITA